MALKREMNRHRHEFGIPAMGSGSVAARVKYDSYSRAVAVKGEYPTPVVDYAASLNMPGAGRLVFLYRRPYR